MLKKKPRGRPAKPRKALVDRVKIAATIEKLRQIKAPNAKSAQAISLMISWLSDESGYDEEAWPQLKRALELNRKRAGERRLFHG